MPVRPARAEHLRDWNRDAGEANHEPGHTEDFVATLSARPTWRYLRRMRDRRRRSRDRSPDGSEGILFVTALIVAPLLTRSKSAESATSTSSRSGIAAAGFFLFGFNFFVGLRKVTTLTYPMAANACFADLVLRPAAGLVRLAWVLGAG